MSIKSKLNGAVKLISDEGFRIQWLASRHFYDGMEDEEYLRCLFRAKVGYDLDLENPKTFNEKLQWLKLHDRRPEYTMMVDKYRAKEYVAGIIGAEHIIPTLGVWDSFDAIDFDALPEQFVLKCTHDSGGLLICKDKGSLDKKLAKKKIEKCLKYNYYWNSREWCYKDVPRKIIAEQYMEDTQVGDLRDYKIHCFHGEPKWLQVIGNRNHKAHTANQLFYTFGWKPASWSFGDYPPYPYELERPNHLDQMYDFAKRLSNGHIYLRVDLYEINDVVYFGEMTFYPRGGVYRYNDIYHYETDAMLGDLLILPEKR